MAYDGVFSVQELPRAVQGETRQIVRGFAVELTGRVGTVQVFFADLEPAVAFRAGRPGCRGSTSPATRCSPPRTRSD